MSQWEDVYILSEGKPTPISSYIADRSRGIAGFIEVDPTLGTKENPIPFNFDIPRKDIIQFLNYTEFNIHETSQEHLLNRFRLYDYIGYDEGLNTIKHQLIDYIAKGDFEHYSELFDMMYSFASSFNLTDRDIRAILLNPIYFFADETWTGEKEGKTVHARKECLITNYEYTHQDSSLMHRVFFESEEIDIGENTRTEDLLDTTIKEIRYMPSYRHDYNYKVSKGYLVFLDSMSLWMEEDEIGYTPFLSMSGNPLNVLDNKAGDRLMIRANRDKAPNVISVINMSIYDMTDSIREQGKQYPHMANPKDRSKGLWLV